MNPTIVLDQVHAGHLPNQDVLTAVNLTVTPGLTWLTGPNGSGKSTALEVMAGTVRIRSGRALLCGAAVHTPAAWAQRSVCLAKVSLFPGLTLAEHSTLLRLAGGIDPDRLEQRLLNYGLGPWRDTMVAELSTGTLRKAWLCLSTAAESPVLLLDEPFTGLDTAGVEILINEIQGWRENHHTIVLVTHQQVAGVSSDHLIDITDLRSGATDDPL